MKQCHVFLVYCLQCTRHLSCAFYSVTPVLKLSPPLKLNLSRFRYSRRSASGLARSPPHPSFRSAFSLLRYFRSVPSVRSPPVTGSSSRSGRTPRRCSPGSTGSRRTNAAGLSHYCRFSLSFVLFSRSLLDLPERVLRHDQVVLARIERVASQHPFEILLALRTDVFVQQKRVRPSHQQI